MCNVPWNDTSTSKKRNLALATKQTINSGSSFELEPWEKSLSDMKNSGKDRFRGDTKLYGR